jgi:hypothetical protein
MAPSFSVETTGLGPSADTYIEESAPDDNWGVYWELHAAGKNPPGTRERALLKFDQGQIQDVIADGTLVSATLRLHVTDASQMGPNGRYLGVHRMLQDWDQFGATWACANDTVPNQASDCAPGNQWNMAGAPLPFATVGDSVLVTNASDGSDID